MKHILLLAALSTFLAGCMAQRNNVIAGTGTVLGFELAQNPATSLYQAKLGYARQEVAFVPTNKGDDGASTTEVDSADVLMELNFHNIFKGGGVYQRLAIGKNATSQPGAAFMFAKSPDGTLDPAVGEAIADSINTIPTTDANADAGKANLATAYASASNKEVWDSVARRRGFSSFSAFLSKTSTTPGDVADMKTELVAAKLIQP